MPSPRLCRNRASGWSEPAGVASCSSASPKRSSEARTPSAPMSNASVLGSSKSRSNVALAASRSRTASVIWRIRRMRMSSRCQCYPATADGTIVRPRSLLAIEPQARAQERSTDVRDAAARVRDNVGRVIVGLDGTVELLLVALLCEGHVLIEDVPGVGKTMLAKALARSLELTFRRIQFTPDLLPSDVTGLSYFNQKT